MKPTNLHGNAPDKCAVALLLVDVINDMEFPGGDRLIRSARPAAQALASLKQRALRAGVPCIYANDNFGRWRSDFQAQVKHVQSGTRGAELAELLAPTDKDYFVLKARHSAFYQTCLSLLLEHLGVEALIVGGYTTDSCVNFTASDAYLRGLALTIPRDGSAAKTATQHKVALSQMSRVLHAQTPYCADISFVRRKTGTMPRIRAR
jgi:nicotinamidase-related amidase